MNCIATNILTPLASGEIVYLPDCYITIEDKKIVSIAETASCQSWTDKRDCFCIPGLIDSHVHLSQLYIRGKYAPDLMNWLNKYTFPAERMSKDQEFSRKIAQDFYQQCIVKGTTTSVVYTSPFREACETAFQVAAESGVRSIIGMTMMDSNCPAYLKQSTAKALQNSYSLWEKWHDQGLLDYIFSPRFALTCSGELLQETGKLVNSLGARLQSHLSENLNEIEQVLKMFPGSRSYTELYYQSGILGRRSIMGHAVHLNSEEISLLKDTDTRIAFCPDSNFFLKSGQFNWQKIKSAGIKTGLASDVGAGTDLSMLKIMKYADYILDKPGLTPEEAFYHGTLGNAVLLGWEDKIGSIETGKEADLVFIRQNDLLSSAADKSEKLAILIYLNDEIEIDSTWIQGKKMFDKDISGGSDEIS